uniref:hypothetical protein n=1 Tax=Streptomyces atratus TaxID=1893 RepID=UPI002F9103E5
MQLPTGKALTVRAAADRRSWASLAPAERRRLIGPEGGSCLLAVKNGGGPFTRTAFYGTRPYSQLRAEFERRRQALQQTGDIPDPREAQIVRLKAGSGNG